AAQAADRLTAASKEREKALWLLLAAIAVIALLLARWALLSIQGPLSRLVTAAERFGGGDLRPVTVGEMPREFRVLAEAMQRMADRLRRIVGEVVGESDLIAGSAGDLSATSQQLAASSSQVSTAMVEISGGRAGGHGRGFAVVAEEVRQLADESARAAEEVTRTTGLIREHMEEVSATMTAGQAKVRGIESIAEGAARGLAEIVAAIEQVEHA